MRTLFFILISILTFSSVAGQNITREYDEFTGETCFRTNMNGSVNFKKVIAENGDGLIVLSWVGLDFVSSLPTNGNSILTLLFEDNTRLTVNIYLVYDYNEDWSGFVRGLVEKWAYNVNGEVILNASQIAKLKEKRVKKYRMGNSGEGKQVDDPEQFRNSFLALLQAN